MIGLFRVLSTCLSIFLSHISLIVHPAPLITRAPAPNTASRERSGIAPGTPANPILQPQGQNNNHVPDEVNITTLTLNYNIYILQRYKIEQRNSSQDIE